MLLFKCLAIREHPAINPPPPTGTNKVSTFEIANMKKSLQKIVNKKQILTEEEENGMLSEKNIKPQE